MKGVKDKKILIFGLGRSGAAAATLLSRLGAEVTVTDKKSCDELREYTERLSPSVRLCLGGYPSNMNGTDMIVVSPGVPLSIEPILNARKKGIKVIGELELAYQTLKAVQHPSFLAITGTNGKSTTTTLLDLMLRRSGFRTILGGNIGNALTEEIQEAISYQLSAISYIVAEVSSFQLESIEEFKPKVAAILNITPDHMDRYHSMDEYREAKANIFMNQDENDFLVLNADDPETMKLYNEKFKIQKAKSPGVYFFSRKGEVKGIYFRGGQIYCNIPDLPLAPYPLPLIGADGIRIKGVHNLENAMASAAMALLAGCLPDAAVEALRDFPGLEHRLEFVREIDGIKFINDSKGTNVGAVLKSIEGFPEPIILIAGGRDKAGDFAPLMPLIREKVKAIILIGEAALKFQKAFGRLTRTVIASDMEDAVSIARGMARSGDIVLLSPACASFDMFRDFEDRGRRFKDAVMRLTRDE
ncbi:MAG: UDP-N-acetylmuramoyl-L-alanine--D-glutamate ligase [Thermodesulfovibrionales bacterium]